MTVNLPSVFESAVAEVVMQADITNFPRIRTWRSVDAESRWSPSDDHTLPLIFITAGTPEPDAQDERQVTVTVGALVNSADDLSHKTISNIESGIQDALDKLEAQYCKGGMEWSAFIGRIETEMAGADYTLNIGGVEAGPAQEPFIDEGVLSVSMQIVIHYSRSDR